MIAAELYHVFIIKNYIKNVQSFGVRFLNFFLVTPHQESDKKNYITVDFTKTTLIHSSKSKLHIVGTKISLQKSSF